jgi:hypothetical protein
MAEATGRHGLPLLVAGQGQKDITHNEALEAVDALLHAVAESRTTGVPPAEPTVGQCWIVAAGATGAWAGQDLQLASWTAGGWRFRAPAVGVTLWVRDEARRMRWNPGWVAEGPTGVPGLPLALPEGGTTIDSEARASIATIIVRLRELGLINV